MSIFAWTAGTSFSSTASVEGRSLPSWVSYTDVSMGFGMLCTL